MTADPIDLKGGRRHPAAFFLGRLLRAAVAAALLWWALRDTRWPELRAAVVGADWRWLAAAVTLVLLDRVLMAWRWLLLLRAVTPRGGPGLGQILRLFFVSTFVGTILPGSIGGDAVRAVSLSRLNVPTAAAVASVAVDRILGTVSVALMGVAGLFFAGRLVDGRVMGWAAALAILATLGTSLLLFDSRVLARTVDVLAGPFKTIHRLAHKFLAAIRAYGAHRQVLATVLAASLAVQVLRTLQAWCLGLALGIGIGAVWYFAWIPAIVLVMLLPISINGLGTGNAAFVLLFGLAGVGASDALVLSVLFLGLGIVGNLPGGLLMMVEPRGAPTGPV